MNCLSLPKIGRKDNGRYREATPGKDSKVTRAVRKLEGKFSPGVGVGVEGELKQGGPRARGAEVLGRPSLNGFSLGEGAA